MVHGAFFFDDSRFTRILSKPYVMYFPDSRSLCGTKDAAGQAAMLGHLRDLCDASRAICDSAGQPKVTFL